MSADVRPRQRGGVEKRSARLGIEVARICVAPIANGFVVFGQPIGFGFVDFGDPADLEREIKLCQAGRAGR